MTHRNLPSALRAAPVLVFVLLALGAEPAQASGAPIIDEQAVAGVVLVASALHFAPVDLVFAAIGRPMPIWLSCFQIAVAGLLVPAMALSVDDSSAITAGAAASMIWFTGHGVYNLAAYPAFRRKTLEERARRREQERQRRNLEGLQYGWSLQPDARAGMLHLRAAL